jgi:hypothetical protein
MLYQVFAALELEDDIDVRGWKELIEDGRASSSGLRAGRGHSIGEKVHPALL